MSTERGGVRPQSPEPNPKLFIEVLITDTGNGIAPENRGKLFQPLFTAKAKDIGLRLVVSKRLAEANGGSIKV